MADNDKLFPLHFGNMDFKPDEVKVLPVVGGDGKPWRGVVKPKAGRAGEKASKEDYLVIDLPLRRRPGVLPEPYRHPFLNTDSRD